jgi:hypothetical protein
LDRRQGGPQGRSGRGDAEKNPYPCRDSNLSLPSHSLVTMATRHCDVRIINIVTAPHLCVFHLLLGYGLNDRGSRVRFPAGAGNFSLHQSVQNGSGVHPASYSMGTRGSFSGDKAARA